MLLVHNVGNGLFCYHSDRGLIEIKLDILEQNPASEGSRPYGSDDQTFYTTYTGKHVDIVTLRRW